MPRRTLEKHIRVLLMLPKKYEMHDKDPEDD